MLKSSKSAAIFEKGKVFYNDNAKCFQGAVFVFKTKIRQKLMFQSQINVHVNVDC